MEREISKSDRGKSEREQRFQSKTGEGVKEREEREGKGPPRAEQLALL